MTSAILILVVCSSAPPTDDRDSPKPEAVLAAVEKALPLIRKSTAEYPESRDCFSCHHQAVPVLALSTARDRGFVVPAEAIGDPVELTEADLRGSIASYRKGDGQGGGVTRAGYALLTLEVGGKKPDEVTDAVAEYLLKKDESQDHWRGTSNRPPSEASEFTSTYLALRALAAYGKEGQSDRIAARMEKARRWLEATKPGDTEDRAFRLLGLRAASASDESIRKASDDLLATRREDGGWSQLDSGKSAAYATGSALVALHLAGGRPTPRRIGAA